MQHLSALQWCHNGHNGVSTHQSHHCLLNVYSSADQRKHQSSASLAFVWGINRWPVKSPHKWPVTRKVFPFDDVIMVLLDMWQVTCSSIDTCKACDNFAISYDDVIQWKHFPRYRPFAWGIHRPRWIPRTKDSDAELWCFLSSAPEWRLSKKSWGWWVETPSCPLWRHCNVNLCSLFTNWTNVYQMGFEPAQKYVNLHCG